MSGRIIVDNARLYADAENRQAVRDFEANHEQDK